MFIHNLKYTVKTLFRNRILIFWTFAFPIILGIFFNMAFSNIESDEALKVFDIAVVDNDDFKVQEIYKEALKELSSDDNEDKLFNIHYVDEDEAGELLDDADIEGYVIFKGDEPQVVIRENGMYQTIIQFVVNEIRQNKMVLEDLTPKAVENEIKAGNTSFDVNEIVEIILAEIAEKKVNLTDISSSNLSYMQVEFYTLIAMACMYGGMLGMVAINNCLANMSDKGKRISVSPNRKSIVVLSSAMGAYIVSLVGLVLLLMFLKFIIKVDFGDNAPLVVLLSLVGNLAGISLGIFTACVFKCSEGAKTGIDIAITMFFAVLSGMMGVELKYLIDKNVPIVNLVNPNNLITDGFYSLYYYDTPDRYFRDIRYLIYFIVITLFISFISLRREQYDSI